MAYWQDREFDGRTADAVALMTLWIGATDADDARARRLLHELLADRRGPLDVIEALQTLCAALLMLFEVDTGVAPDEVMRRIGAMVAAAGTGAPAPG